jgi:hypothetical protein
MSTCASLPDSAANAVLDFVSVEESDGNYDAYIGHAGAPAGTITGKTIAEVYAFQRQLVDDGEPSSAAGRYQFIQVTLEECVQTAGLPLTTLFTPAVQDQLALQLLNTRGFARWRVGELSDAAFAHNLSCEWASLPDPQNAGKSHYDGVGPNHAGRTLSEVYAALAAARASTVSPT